MPRILFALAVACAISAPVFAADPPPDTPAAAFARVHKLATKITIDLKNATLKEAFQAISDELEAQKRGPLVVRLGPSVPSMAKVTYQAEGVPLLLVLDQILKPHDLGFVIISKENDRTDGWMEIAQGSMRGYPTGIGPDPASIVQAAMPAEAPKVSEQDEKLAGIKLDLAKKLQAENEVDRAKIQLKFIVRFYPGTKAAAEAKPLLEKLSP
jgi:hypothetical protein